MKKKTVAIVNQHSTSGVSALPIAKRLNFEILNLERNMDLVATLKKFLDAGCHKFYIFGGDGTLNWFLNSYMQLPKIHRKKIVIGLAPCGKANDFARKLKIPFDVTKAIDYSEQCQPRSIDVVQVNSKYFLTGGGLGLPSEVIQHMADSSMKKVWSKIFKDLLYYYVVLKKMIFGYSGTQIHHVTNTNLKGQYMLLSVSNQEFIGKRFHISPESKNDDGIIELCAIDKPANPIRDLRVLHRVTRGRHTHMDYCSLKQFKNITISLSRSETFMADGELLDESDQFKISVIPKAIHVLY